jgi:hypothetical protein
MKENATLPSGHTGVFRAKDGRHWEAYVMEEDLVLLGVFKTIRAAVEARAKYWRRRKRRRTFHQKR